mmetsp:Transcript_36345/g.84342  ORF Transcript_36345/g.84342 Transcript_36345/m.84342 type:complete len:181 (-) Transcript_36345:60-602(-)
MARSLSVRLQRSPLATAVLRRFNHVLVMGDQKTVALTRQTLPWWEQQLCVLQRVADLQNSAFSLSFIGESKMKYLNKTYRFKNKPTNVLAFRFEEVVPEVGDLGDIFVCPHVAIREGIERSEPLQKVLDHLIVHGLCHLCGFDHDTDQAEMSMLHQERVWLAAWESARQLDSHESPEHHR